MIKLADMDINQEIIPYMKIDIIYAFMQHTLTKKQISDMLGIKYCTVLSLIKSYQRYGKIFKLLNFNSKSYLLKQRVQNIESQRLYKIYRRNLLTRLTASKQPQPQYRWINQASKHSPDDPHQIIEEHPTITGPPQEQQQIVEQEDGHRQ